MPTLQTLGLFALAALLLAAMPGPGLFYVVGRTLASGRRDGLASCVGTALGGAVHVIAGTVGVSALVMESATAFTVLKFCGGLYLIALAIQTWRDSSPSLARVQGQQRSSGPLRALRQAFVVEATNPKTAAFFLALIPQFIALDRDSVALQFILLGSISVARRGCRDGRVVAGSIGRQPAHAVVAAQGIGGNARRAWAFGAADPAAGVKLIAMLSLP